MESLEKGGEQEIKGGSSAMSEFEDSSPGPTALAHQLRAIRCQRIKWITLEAMDTRHELRTICISMHLHACFFFINER